MRTCVGCRRRRPMDELVRVARDERGRLVLGRDRPGRGAWLCRSSAACVDRAIERRAFNRAFRVRLQEAQVDRDRLVAGSAPASARGGGLGGLGSLMCEDRGSYVRTGTYDME